jgi:hypothetical protein
MRVAIEALDPTWLDGKADWGCGLRILCPVHDGQLEHYIEIFFESCCGGSEVHAPDMTRYMRRGTSFITLSLDPAVEVAGCFRGWLVDGIFHVVEH